MPTTKIGAEHKQQECKREEEVEPYFVDYKGKAIKFIPKCDLA